MTAVAPHTKSLRALEADTRQAWTAYTDRLRELTGEEYERLEPESWSELQAELVRLQRRRDELTPAA